MQLEHVTALHTVNHPERNLYRKGKLKLRSPLPISHLISTPPQMLMHQQKEENRHFTEGLLSAW